MRKLFLAILILLASNSWGEVLINTADTWISSLHSSTNYGSDIELYIRKSEGIGIGSGWEARTLIRFDNITDLDLIASAKVWVYIKGKGLFDMPINMYPCEAQVISWSEYLVTWDNSPAYIPDIKCGLQSTPIPGEYYFDIMPIIDYWENGGMNNGLAIVITNPPTGFLQVWYYSKECSEQYCPQMEITREPFANMQSVSIGKIKGIFK